MNEYQKPLTQAVSIATGLTAVFHLGLFGSSTGLVSLGAAYMLVLGASHAIASGESVRPLHDTRRPWDHKGIAAGTIAVSFASFWVAIVGFVIWKNLAKKGASTTASGGFAQFEERVAALRDQVRAEGNVELAEKLSKVSQASAVIQQVTQGPAPVERPATAPLKSPTRNLDTPRPAKKATTRALPPEPAPIDPVAAEPAPLDNWGLATGPAPSSDLDRWGLTSSVSTTTTTTTTSYADSFTQPATNGFDEALAILQGKNPDER